MCHIWNAVHIGLIIWHHFLFCENVVLVPNYIVSKIENIPPIGKFSKIKNKKTAITFGEECTLIDNIFTNKFQNKEEFYHAVSSTNCDEIDRVTDTQQAFDRFHNQLTELYNKTFPESQDKKEIEQQKAIAVWRSDKLFYALE